MRPLRPTEPTELRSPPLNYARQFRDTTLEMRPRVYFYLSQPTAG